MFYVSGLFFSPTPSVAFWDTNLMWSSLRPTQIPISVCQDRRRDDDSVRPMAVAGNEKELFFFNTVLSPIRIKDTMLMVDCNCRCLFVNGGRLLSCTNAALPCSTKTGPSLPPTVSISMFEHQQHRHSLFIAV